MNQNKDWFYNEFNQVGTDYMDLNQVKIYDEKMNKLRNINAEVNILCKLIDIQPSYRILEIGCGTGEFSIALGKKSKELVALDVSSVMIEYAKHKAGKIGLDNINFYNNGFLTYKYDGIPFDAVITSLALHHLPDFWKLIALKRIHSMLKQEGYFYLYDVVYSFEPDEYIKYFNQWTKALKKKKIDDGGITHIKSEYSTTSKIMESIIKEAGFMIEYKDLNNKMFAVYLCRKVKKDKNGFSDIWVNYN